MRPVARSCFNGRMACTVVPSTTTDIFAFELAVVVPITLSDCVIFIFERAPYLGEFPVD